MFSGDPLRGISVALVAALLFTAAQPFLEVRDRAFAAEEIDFQNVTVKPGQTLWSIANDYLKDPKKWDEILKHNRLPSKDPTVALPGMTLKVPTILIKEDLRAAKVVQKRNNVFFRRKETAEWKTAALNMELFKDDAVRTLEDSQARVNFIDQGILQVDPNSMAIIRPAKKDYDVFLKSGGVFVGRAKVVTVSAEITPRTLDTSYSAQVRADLSTRVQVYRGQATVKSQGKSVNVDAGMGTEVRLGAAPSVPFTVPDLPDFEVRGAEFTGDFKLVRNKAGVRGPADIGRAPAPGANAPAASIEDIYVDVNNMRVMMPLLGYHLQFSNTQDFDKVQWEKTFEVESKVRPVDIKLPPGRYWVKMFPIDLLGARGSARPAKPYMLGAGGITAVATAGVRITQPGSDGEVVADGSYRVSGQALPGSSVMVNGRRARVDEGGGFSALVPLTPGENRIDVTAIAPGGVTTGAQRRVKYQLP
ncbi:MAG: LysM peptidoglycan-binding domain-containing protein [Elusimicrobia bacterium]|nr:LysM peptidoglycan-binding domain-containing protein [Elusimicrobiota bacterium]